MKRLLSVIVVLSMISVFFAYPVSYAVDYDNHWAKGSIDQLISAGVLTPDSSGNVSPDMAMPRHAFVALVNTICNFTQPASDNFADIAADSPYASVFAVAKAAGYIQGDADGNANPESTITRSEVAVILCRVLNIITEGADTSKFDSADVPAWSMPAVAALNSKGIMKGNPDGTFAGDKQMTNAEGYTMAVRILNTKSAKGMISSQGDEIYGLEMPTSFAGKLEGFNDKLITPLPSMKAFSIKIAALDDKTTYKVFYKKTADADTAWRVMYTPTYSLKDNAYYTSATMTSENANYDLMVIPYVDGVAYEPIKYNFKTLYRNNYEDILPYFYAPSELFLYPTFENASYYVPFEGQGAECSVTFTEEGQSVKRTAFAPLYYPEQKQFRGSIVDLKEGTTYNVTAEVKQNGKVVKTYTNKFTTNTSDVKIGETIKLKDVYKDGSLVLENIKGTPDSWVKIVDDGTTVIDGGIRFGNGLSKGNREAVLISNCEYVILEGLTVKGGGKHGIAVVNNSNNVRIINCDISNWGSKTTIAANVEGFEVAFVDENGSRINNEAGVYITDVKDILVERCFIHDPRAKANAWYGPKDGNENGVAWERAHPGGPNAVISRGQGGIVIRYNDMPGSDDHRWNDVIEGIDNGYKYGSVAKDADVYGNLLSCSQDDAIEFDGGAMNVRFYKNRLEQTYTNISTAPNIAGPLYIFRNLVFNGGDEYFAVGGHMKQGGGTSMGGGMNFVFNNTFEINGTGLKDPGMGNDADRQRHAAYMLNNIVATNKSNVAINDKFENGNFYDYNMIGYRDPSDITKDLGATVSTGGEEYVQDHGIKAVETYVNMLSADFRLVEKSLGVDKGTVIPNFTDNAKGSAPDMGAYELGESYFLPFRPVDFIADKYMVEGNATITVKTGNMGGATGYQIKSVNAIAWLSVTPAKGTFNDNSTYEFKINIDQSRMTRGEEQTVFIIKLDNGYSMPITVKAINPDLPVIKSGH